MPDILSSKGSGRRPCGVKARAEVDSLIFLEFLWVFRSPMDC